MPLLKRQMLPSYLCTFDKLLVDSWQIKIANMYRNIHASKRQKPTAQGDTLGKHPYVGLRPVRAKALHIKALRMLLSLQDVHTPFNITRGVTPGCTLLPLRGVNLQCTPTRGNILCCALFLLGCIK